MSSAMKLGTVIVGECGAPGCDQVGVNMVGPALLCRSHTDEMLDFVAAIVQRDRDHREGSLVYFGRRASDGFIKIGVSQQVRIRARSLGIEVLGTTPGDRITERKMHERFAKLRREGEWFEPHPRLMRHIETLDKPWWAAREAG